MTGWVPPDTCVAEDCRLQEPLPLSMLSPNLLLVLVHASARDKEVRDSIRETWLSGLSNWPNSPIQYRLVSHCTLHVNAMGMALHCPCSCMQCPKINCPKINCTVRMVFWRLQIHYGNIVSLFIICISSTFVLLIPF